MTWRRLWRTALLVAAIVLFVRPGLATPFDLEGSDWEGASELVRIARAELGAPRVFSAAQIDFSTREFGVSDLNYE